MRRNLGLQRALHLFTAAIQCITPLPGLQKTTHLERVRGIALVQQHQYRLRGIALLQHAVEHRLIALQTLVDLQAALQCGRCFAQFGDALQGREDRALPCSIHTLLAEVGTVAGMLGTAAHEAGFRAVIQHRNTACGEQPVVRIDEAGIAGVQTRHVVVVVEAHQCVWIRIRATAQMQRFRQGLKTLLLLAEYR